MFRKLPWGLGRVCCTSTRTWVQILRTRSRTHTHTYHCSVAPPPMTSQASKEWNISRSQILKSEANWVARLGHIRRKSAEFDCISIILFSTTYILFFAQICGFCSTEAWGLRPEPGVLHLLWKSSTIKSQPSLHRYLISWIKNGSAGRQNQNLVGSTICTIFSCSLSMLPTVYQQL